MSIRRVVWTVTRWSRRGAPRRCAGSSRQVPRSRHFAGLFIAPGTGGWVDHEVRDLVVRAENECVRAFPPQPEFHQWLQQEVAYVPVTIVNTPQAIPVATT